MTCYTFLLLIPFWENRLADNLLLVHRSDQPAGTIPEGGRRESLDFAARNTVGHLVQGKCLSRISHLTVAASDGSSAIDAGTEVSHRPCCVQDDAGYTLVGERDGIDHHANLTVLLESEPLEVTECDVLLLGGYEGSAVERGVQVVAVLGQFG